MGRYEEIIADLRQMGCSKIDIIRSLSKQFNITIGEAKAEVHFSSAWSDTQKGDEDLHDALEVVAEEKKTSD